MSTVKNIMFGSKIYLINRTQITQMNADKNIPKNLRILRVSASKKIIKAQK